MPKKTSSYRLLIGTDMPLRLIIQLNITDVIPAGFHRISSEKSA